MPLLAPRTGCNGRTANKRRRANLEKWKLTAGDRDGIVQDKGFFDRAEGEGFAAGILGGGIYMDVRCAGLIEALLNGFAGEFGAIALAAKMTEVDMFEFGRNKFG